MWQTVFYCFSTASGLHHQLIVTQERVCLRVLLQSPAILSAAVLLVAWRQGHLSQRGEGAEGAVMDPGAWTKNRIRTKVEKFKEVYVLNRWLPWFHVKRINVEIRVKRFYKNQVSINFPLHQHSTIILNDFTSLGNHFIIFSVFNLTTALQQSANREMHGLLGN